MKGMTHLPHVLVKAITYLKFQTGANDVIMMEP